MQYEHDMHIFHDPKTDNVLVTFRGKVFVLPGPHEDRWHAILAAEKECRLRGWQQKKSD